MADSGKAPRAVLGTDSVFEDQVTAIYADVDGVAKQRHNPVLRDYSFRPFSCFGWGVKQMPR